MYYTKKYRFIFTDVLVRISFWKIVTAIIGDRRSTKNIYRPEYLTQEKVLQQTAKIKRTDLLLWQLRNL